ncbi:hypothetical protein Droror1_Dr00016911 [Drosera rotundifolia]
MANNAATAAGGIPLKLIFDKQSNRILYAEGRKDFVDFLLHIFSLPLAAVVRLLSKDAMVGCLGDLYACVENLSDEYMEPTFKKDALLKLCPASNCPVKSPFLRMEAVASKFYSCAACRLNYVCAGVGGMCQYCKKQMSWEIIYVGMGNSGYVRSLVTYMIMDDLAVKPMSTVTCITDILNKFNLKDVTSLGEEVVHVGVDEGLALLKASLETKNVLNKVFLGKETTVKQEKV